MPDLSSVLLLGKNARTFAAGSGRTRTRHPSGRLEIASGTWPTLPNQTHLQRKPELEVSLTFHLITNSNFIFAVKNSAIVSAGEAPHLPETTPIINNPADDRLRFPLLSDPSSTSLPLDIITNTDKMAPEPSADHPEHKKKVNLMYVVLCGWRWMMPSNTPKL